MVDFTISAVRWCRFGTLVPTMGTPPNLWKILTLLSLVWAAFFTVPYILKCLLYPGKVGQHSWRCPRELAGSLLACLFVSTVRVSARTLAIQTEVV